MTVRLCVIAVTGSVTQIPFLIIMHQNVIMRWVTSQLPNSARDLFGSVDCSSVVYNLVLSLSCTPISSEIKQFIRPNVRKRTNDSE
jgi:hypothetical protein